MSSISQLKHEAEDRLSQLLKDHRVFFAFSDKQFEEGKTELKEGEKYVSLGLGGYCPDAEAKPFHEACDRNWKKYRGAIEEHGLRKELIEYELANHEAYYTGDIETTMMALGEGYEEEEIWEVYYKTRSKYDM